MGAAWLTGRRGQGLALMVTLLLCLVVWFGVAQPLLGWYNDRAETLQQQRALAQRMESLAASLLLVRRQAQAGAGTQNAANAILKDTDDSVASATLQEKLQAMATAAGASLTSVETLPAESAGAWRRIGLRVNLTAPWPVLVRLLQSLDGATPRMLVDDLHLHSTVLVARPTALPLQTSLVVYAFRGGATSAGGRS